MKGSVVFLLLQWTPLGFRTTDPKTFDDISKERFQGTVLKTISKSPQIYQTTKDGAKGDPDPKVGGSTPPHLPAAMWRHRSNERLLTRACDVLCPCSKGPAWLLMARFHRGVRVGPVWVGREWYCSGRLHVVFPPPTVPLWGGRNTVRRVRRRAAQSGSHPLFGSGNATRTAPLRTEPTRTLQWKCAIREGGY